MWQEKIVYVKRNFMHEESFFDVKLYIFDK